LSSGDLQTTLRNGIDAAKRGDRTTARRLLEQVIARDDRNEMAWIWLASVVNTNAERRNALERVLQINPRNSRAREALAKLNEPTGAAAYGEQSRVRDTISRVRQAQNINTSTIEGSGGSNLAGLLLLIGLVAAAIIVGVLLLNGFNQNTPEPTAVVLAPTDAPTSTVTFTPSPSPTPEDRSAAEVTRVLAPTLPPTFTPTEPPPASSTPTPTSTPIGLENFPMLYTSLNTGAAQPDLYSLNADGSNDGFLLEGVRDIAVSLDGSQIAFIRDIPGSSAIVAAEQPDATEEPTELQPPTPVDLNATAEIGLPESPTEAPPSEVQTTTSDQLAAEVFVASIDDLENPRQITTLNAADTSSPSFSPDGSLIVFSSSAGQPDSEIYIVESAGGTPRPLTNNSVIDREPSFSPVANVIAYTSDQDSPGLTEIYTLPLTEDGNIEGDASPRRITDTSGSNYSPSWSFDGARIVFLGDRTGSGDVYIVDNEIGGPGELVTIGDGDAENRSPVLSPDGLWVAYISNRDSEDFQVYLTDLGGFEVRRLTDNGRNDTSVVFQYVDLSEFFPE
jgi:Tol biopolymer transport system component